MSGQQHESLVANLSFEELVDCGVYEFAGFDEQGEMTFRLDADVAKVKAPQIYWKHQNDMMEKLMTAIEEGFIDWEVHVHGDDFQSELVFDMEKVPSH